MLDCDHVPLPTFLTATLGWFDDPKIALVQGPQSFYNSGAFDDDGYTGEQGVFFHVLMAGRQPRRGRAVLVRLDVAHPGLAPCARSVASPPTTIVEDMHTTLELIRPGWKTAYHHQTLAVGLAPATPEQYLLQRRRWGMGAMQVLISERLWAAKRWLSWRNYYEYLSGTLWWLEGVGTVLAFFIPALVLVSGARCRRRTRCCSPAFSLRCSPSGCGARSGSSDAISIGRPPSPFVSFGCRSDCRACGG